jgi:hypothetical protein
VTNLAIDTSIGMSIHASIDAPIERRKLLLIAVAITVVPRPGAAAALDLAALMALLAQRKSGEARFTEERVVTGFDSPLRSSGTLSFTAPDRFERRTLEPRPESMKVAGNQLTLERAGRTRQMALDAIPELAALIEAVRGTLAGNGAALQRVFRAEVGGHAGLWTLTLTPLDAKVAVQVRSIQIAGAGPDLRSVELQLGQGERSLMLIEPAAETGEPARARQRGAPR